MWHFAARQACLDLPRFSRQRVWPIKTPKYRGTVDVSFRPLPSLSINFHDGADFADGFTFSILLSV